jgi:hypothetical protein
MAMVKLTRANRYDPWSRMDCYVDPDQVESIRECLVGERSSGSRLRMQSGDDIEVWESVHTVHDLLFGSPGEA